MALVRRLAELPDGVEAVLAAVDALPPGRVATYGDVAALAGWGGPRQAGSVMARYGSAVAWWRVVRADGRPAQGHEVEALRRLRAEGVPLRGDRVDMARARIQRGDVGARTGTGVPGGPGPTPDAGAPVVGPR